MSVWGSIWPEVLFFKLKEVPLQGGGACPTAAKRRQGRNFCKSRPRAN